MCLCGLVFLVEARFSRGGLVFSWRLDFPLEACFSSRNIALHYTSGCCASLSPAAGTLNIVVFDIWWQFSCRLAAG